MRTHLTITGMMKTRLIDNKSNKLRRNAQKRNQVKKFILNRDRRRRKMKARRKVMKQIDPYGSEM